MLRQFQRRESLIATIFITLTLTIGVIYFATYVSMPKYSVRLYDLVSDVQVFDRNSQLLHRGSLEQIRRSKLSPESWKMRVTVDWEEVTGNSALYLEPMLTATSVDFALGGGEAFGSFRYDTPPRTQSALIPFPKQHTNSSFVIEYLMTSMIGDQFILLDKSGVGDYQSMQVNRFFKTFLTSYGFLGLACVFLTASLVLIMIGINFPGQKGLITLGLASIAMAWITLYFSRILNDLPFLTYINQVSFSVYFLIQGFLSLTAASWFQNRHAQNTAKGISCLAFGFSLVQILLAVLYPLGTLLEVYKILVIISVFGWFLLAILGSFTNDRIGHEWIERLVVSLSLWIVTFGQANDSLRVFYPDIFQNNLGPYFWFIAVLLLIGLVCHAIYQKYSNTLVNEKTLAIAQTTQMLAHDVKKPFSLIENLLIIFRSSSDPAKIKKIAEDHIDDVQQAINSVNGMIADVMEIGSHTKPVMQALSLDTLLLKSLKESTSMLPKKQARISWELGKDIMVEGEPEKLLRVFSNIIPNALQAMDEGCHIWFASKTNSKGMVELSIGNSGSYIAKEDLPKLFNTFYTKGKSGGTGLGLAIAHKIVSAHGGQIWCESSRHPDHVIFKLTLPLAADQTNKETELPQHTDEIRGVYSNSSTLGRSDRQAVIVDPREQRYVEALAEWVASKGRPIRIGFLDDEQLYREGFQELIRSSEELMRITRLIVFSDPEDVLKELEVLNLDAFICDIDLGIGKMNGFQLVETMREQQFTSSICVHSNRGLPADFEKALQSGAQAFLPKPMSRPHLQKFLVSAVVKDSSLITSSSNAPDSHDFRSSDDSESGK